MRRHGDGASEHHVQGSICLCRRCRRVRKRCAACAALCWWSLSLSLAGVVAGALGGDAPCAKTRCARTSARLAFGRSVGGTVSFFCAALSLVFALLAAHAVERAPAATAQEGTAKVNTGVRYVSCLFWVLSARQERAPPAADGAALKVPSLHELLRTANVPVYDFFMQTTHLGRVADKLSIFKELLPADGACKRLLKAFTTVEVHFIILIIIFSKLKKIVEDIVPEESRREKLHHATWLLFLNVQSVLKSFDMFPAFCLCVASLHAVLASAKGIDPCVFEEPDEAETSADRAARTEWSESVLAKACLEDSVVNEVKRANSKVCKEWLNLFGSAHDSKSRSKGKETMAKRTGGSAGGCMAEEEVEESCACLSEELNNKLRTLPLAQLDGRILLDSPHLVDRKKGSGSSPGDASSAAEAISGMRNAGDSTRTMVYQMGPPGSPSKVEDAAIFRTPDRPTRPIRPAPPATPITTMQQDHAWLSRFLEGAQGERDPDLVRFLAGCGDNNETRDAVVRRADQIATKLVDADNAQDMGKRFYYWLLREICLKEELRLKRSNFGPLLKDERMHRALLAFCFEVILAASAHSREGGRGEESAERGRAGMI